MTRRRRLPLVARTCIGVFLLLFTAVAADTIKVPPPTEKPQLTEVLSHTNNTLPTEQTSPEPIKRDSEKGLDDSQNLPRSNETERSELPRVSFDDYETSGKSSSTKAVSEDISRLSRTNGLTTVTTKPFEESRNKTAIHREDDYEAENQLPKVRTPERSQSLKNSEVSDLEKTDGEAISLINDTYVNYSHRTTTEGDLGTQSGNGTVSEDVSHGWQDPKEEVEVVGNVTHSIQRIVERSRNNTDKNVGGLSNDENVGNDGEKHEGLFEVTTIRDVEMIQNSSPVPRGRTIAFSSVNEFPGHETKPTVATVDISQSKKNTSEQKPYPYVKSSKEPVRNISNQVDDSIDTSAFENTIGRGDSEKKFVVTEPSVVIENSIQQFKPTYQEKPENQSMVNSSTESESSVSMATVPLTVLEQAKPTNETVIDKYEKVTKTTEKSTTGNDVPRGNEGSEVITGKEDFDVSGNGITEVSAKAESSDERPYESSFQEIANETTVASPISNTTDKAKDTVSNADIQTNAEESLLIRSTLNVTEVSTEYPLMKEQSSESGKSSTVPEAFNSTVLKNTEDFTVIPTIVSNFTEETSVVNVSSGSFENGTNEIPSGLTLNPDESSEPTTTGVEYEFVGLSEASVLQNVTEQVPEERQEMNATTSLPTVQDLAKHSTDEISTIIPEITTDDSLVTSETEVTNDERSTTIPVTDQTIVPTSIPSPTQPKEYTTVPTVIDEQTDESPKEETSKSNDWSTTDTIASTDIIFPVSKDENVNVSIDSIPITTAPSIPLVPSTLHPWTESSTSSTQGTTELDGDMSISPDEITSLVRIVMKGTTHEVCPYMDKLKTTLAEILEAGMNKAVYARQIVFHQNPCTEPATPAPTPTDVPLTSILVYVVDENGKFDSAMTNVLPRLYNESSVKFPVTIQSFHLVQDTDSTNAIAVIVVSSVAFICLVLLAGLLFIMRKRQTRFNYGERCRPVSLDAYSLDSVSAYNSVRRKGAARASKRSYGNPTFEDSSAIPSHPLNFAGLSTFCGDINGMSEEFAGIPQVSARIDELPAGAELKNRYANVIPLPETRVPLTRINNDPLTEYINASYVRGLKNATRYYIACQGPMESTVTDFWRMIWEQQSKVIIMLTDLVENGVEKCTEYIPPSEVTDCHRLYGDFQVTLKKRETKEKYAISTLHLKNLENNTFREVYHIWYLWPLGGVQDGAGLIAVLLEARALQRGGPGPIVVHCSPGTGRTGTLIALDLGIRQYEITRTVDVPRVVYTIRRDRAGAVQTREQYAFIYKALNLYATKLAGGVLEST